MKLYLVALNQKIRAEIVVLALLLVPVFYTGKEVYADRITCDEAYKIGMNFQEMQNLPVRDGDNDGEVCDKYK